MSNNDDDALRDRLNKLVGHPTKIVDQKELEERIARLKGLDPKTFSAPPITVYKPPETRSQHEQADDLLAQLLTEATIDDNVQSSGLVRTASVTDDEIERRLRSLKGSSLAGQPLMEDEDMDSDTEMEKVAKRLLAEAKLPAHGSDADDQDQDLPWCVICNEDAIICCHDCDDDLYCMDCFREFHADPDTKRHRTKALPAN